MKQCTKCRSSSDQFYKNKNSSDGLQSWCKPCMKDYFADKHARTYVANPKPKSDPERLAWGRRIKYAYGITVDDYESMLANQGGSCAGCGVKPDGQRLCVDHDHKCCSGPRSCGKCVRGLLCARCNKLIGLASDNTQTLSNLVSYLQNLAS